MTSHPAPPPPRCPLPGAAFDVPCALATEILARVDELHKRGVSLTAPTALAPEEDLYHTGRGGRGGRGGRCVM